MSRSYPPLQVPYHGHIYTWAVSQERRDPHALHLIEGPAGSGQSLLLHALAAEQPRSILFGGIEEQHRQRSRVPIAPEFTDHEDVPQQPGALHARLFLLSDPHVLPEPGSDERRRAVSLALKALNLAHYTALYFDDPWYELACEEEELQAAMMQAAHTGRQSVTLTVTGHRADPRQPGTYTRDFSFLAPVRVTGISPLRGAAPL